AGSTRWTAINSGPGGQLRAGRLKLCAHRTARPGGERTRRAAPACVPVARRRSPRGSTDAQAVYRHRSLLSFSSTRMRRLDVAAAVLVAQALDPGDSRHG